MTRDKTATHRPGGPPAPTPPEVRAEALFGGAREVRIHHAGEIDLSPAIDGRRQALADQIAFPAIVPPAKGFTE